MPEPPDEPDDYFCCECGRWVPEYVALDRALLDPWGYALKKSTMRMALNWLAERISASEWDWHPVEIEMRRDMRATIAMWPGDVCRDCWAEWPVRNET